MNNHTKPLLSYLLFTYNQENYIREAVESAFAQSYSPLEIIISDDHSTDNTWAIIKELFDKYNGPHKIIINRNSKNLGIANHVNKVMSMAKGELFIMAAGDDISFPERTQVIYNYWYPRRNRVLALTSSNITIDPNGSKTDQKRYVQNNDFLENNIFSSKQFNGAGSAYSSELFNKFKPLTGKVYEDLIYYRRALMLGSAYFIKQPLLQYRLGGLTTQELTDSYLENLNQTIKESETQLACSLMYLLDYKHINYNNSVLQNKLKELHKLAVYRYTILHSNNFYIKTQYLFKLLKLLNKKIGFYQNENMTYRQFIIISLSLLPFKPDFIFSSILYIYKLIFQ